MNYEKLRGGHPSFFFQMGLFNRFTLKLQAPGFRNLSFTPYLCAPANQPYRRLPIGRGKETTIFNQKQGNEQLRIDGDFYPYSER